MWTARRELIASQMRRKAGRYPGHPRDPDAQIFLHRRRWDSAFWDPPPTGRIPPPTERSYPQSSWRLIEEYAATGLTFR